MTRWTFKSLSSGHEFNAGLRLRWELSGDSITDDYLPSETDANELWDRWVGEYGQTVMPVHWFVETYEPGGQFEYAPPSLLPQAPDLGADHEYGFLAHYTWPESADTGERLRWTALPVVDKLWAKDSAASKGGFIQQVTGWKPSPLQSYADVKVLALAAGLTLPSGG
jgi:hypothetical protein